MFAANDSIMTERSTTPKSRAATPSRRADGVRCPRCGQPICRCLLEDRKFLATKVGQLLRGQRQDTRAEPLVPHPHGPITLDDITIHCGDCLDVIPSLPDVNIVVTSIPYNIGMPYGPSCNDARPVAEYLSWLRERFAAIKEKMQDDGSFFLNMDGDGWLPFEVAGVLRHLFCLQNRIQWVKSIVVPERPCPHCGKSIAAHQLGHFRTVGGDVSINRCGEFLLHLTKHRDVHLDRQAVGVRGSGSADGTHCAGNRVVRRVRPAFG